MTPRSQKILLWALAGLGVCVLIAGSFLLQGPSPSPPILQPKERTALPSSLRDDASHKVTQSSPHFHTLQAPPPPGQESENGEVLEN